MPRVAVIVAVLEGRERLPTLLRSLRAQTFADLALCVVDNGSSDGSADEARRLWPDVQVLRFEANRGFSAAVNAGIAATDGEYVALVNDDVELEPAWLAELVRALDADPAAGSAGGKTLAFDRRDVLDGAGDVMSRYGPVGHRGHGERDHGQFDRPEPVMSVSACAALYRRAALERVGPFDERYFAYCEDVDWGLRAQLAAWRALYVPGARAFHVGRATGGRFGEERRRLLLRNTLATIVKTWPAPVLRRHAGRLLAHQLRLCVTAATGELSWRALVGSWAGAARMLPRLLVERRRIQRARTVAPEAIAALLDDAYSPRSDRPFGPDLTARRVLRAAARRAGLAGALGWPAAAVRRLRPRRSRDALERRLVWIFGGPRTGSSWLLAMLVRAGGAFAVDEPYVGAHVAPLDVDPIAPSPGYEKPHLRLDGALRRHREYVLAAERSGRWRPVVRAFVLDLLATLVPLRARGPVVVKEPNGSHAADVIAAALPRSRLLFLARDGRDVVDSMLDAIAQPSWWSGAAAAPLEALDRRELVRHQARLWALRTDAVRRAYAEHDPALRLMVRYEDLRADPAGELRRILDWLGLAPGDAAIDAAVAAEAFDAIPAARRGPGQFARAAQPGLWRERFDAEEQRILAEAMGPLLAELGYEV